MKKIIFFIIVIFVFNLMNAQKVKEVKDFYNLTKVNSKGEAQLKSVGYLNEYGYSVGEWKFYTKDGILEYLIDFDTHISIKLYPSGEIKEKYKFDPDSGNHNGIWISYYKNGFIKTKGFNDERGHKNGVFKTYTNDGNLLNTEIFSKGIKQS